MTTNHPSDVLCPLPRRIERVRVSITSPLVQPSPNGRRVGIRIVTFEACSGFTRVTARRIAQPPKVTFVTRLRSRQLPSETARQLPDLSTIIRVEPSSTDDSRLQGALPASDRITRSLSGWSRKSTTEVQFEHHCRADSKVWALSTPCVSASIGHAGSTLDLSRSTENCWSVKYRSKECFNRFPFAVCRES